MVMRKILPFIAAGALMSMAQRADTSAPTPAETMPASQRVEYCAPTALPNYMRISNPPDVKRLLPGVERLLGNDLPDETVSTIVFNFPGAGSYDVTTHPTDTLILAIGRMPKGFAQGAQGRAQRVYGTHGNALNTLGEEVVLYTVPVGKAARLAEEACQIILPSQTEEPFIMKQLEDLVNRIQTNLSLRLEHNQQVLQTQVTQLQDHLTQLALHLDTRTGDIAVRLGGIDTRIGRLEDLLTATTAEQEKLAQRMSKQIADIYARLTDHAMRLDRLSETADHGLKTLSERITGGLEDVSQRLDRQEETLYTLQTSVDSSLTTLSREIKDDHATILKAVRTQRPAWDVSFNGGYASAQDDAGTWLGVQGGMGIAFMPSTGLGFRAHADYTVLRSSGLFARERDTLILQAGPTLSWEDLRFTLGGVYVRGSHRAQSQLASGDVLEAAGRTTAYGGFIIIANRPPQDDLLWELNARYAVGDGTSVARLNGVRISERSFAHTDLSMGVTLGYTLESLTPLLTLTYTRTSEDPGPSSSAVTISLGSRFTLGGE